ncbi:hypothetical protein MYX84_00705 [Acidobacteria bacterium AH-259-O06]|nr:hypothetical protein [Acidobacteria bacterium AH-259-O06]
MKKWVEPKNRWWMELSKAVEINRKGQRFVGRVNEMSWFFETASYMSRLYPGMPRDKRKEFRQRILGSDNVTPVLTEINMAAHFWQMGFDLEWAEPKTQGERIPEFICKSAQLSYDVDCKTKTVDAGRMVARPSFYKLVDLIVERLRRRGLHGDILIVTPDHLPSSAEWQASVVDAVSDQGPGGPKELLLDDGTSIITSLATEDVLASKQEIDSRLASRQRFTHAAVHPVDTIGTDYVNPIIVYAQSRRNDAFRKSVLKDLREARRQLSGERAGIIVCFVPEVEDFGKVASESALRAVAEKFFEKHAADSVYGVTFISDRKIETTNRFVETLYPAITFYNSHYDPKWGRATLYMATSF